MPPGIPRVEPLAKRGNRWGVILAGGEGVRLGPLTKLICGDERPKQFCPLVDGRTLLARATAAGGAHVRTGAINGFAYQRSPQMVLTGSRALYPSQRVVQPANKGTSSCHCAQFAEVSLGWTRKPS